MRINSISPTYYRRKNVPSFGKFRDPKAELIMKNYLYKNCFCEEQAECSFQAMQTTNYLDFYSNGNKVVGEANEDIEFKETLEGKLNEEMLEDYVMFGLADDLTARDNGEIIGRQLSFVNYYLENPDEIPTEEEREAERLKQAEQDRIENDEDAAMREQINEARLLDLICF